MPSLPFHLYGAGAGRDTRPSRRTRPQDGALPGPPTGALADAPPTPAVTATGPAPADGETAGRQPAAPRVAPPTPRCSATARGDPAGRSPPLRPGTPPARPGRTAPPGPVGRPPPAARPRAAGTRRPPTRSPSPCARRPAPSGTGPRRRAAPRRSPAAPAPGTLPIESWLLLGGPGSRPCSPPSWPPASAAHRPDAAAGGDRRPTRSTPPPRGRPPRKPRQRRHTATAGEGDQAGRSARKPAAPFGRPARPPGQPSNRPCRDAGRPEPSIGRRSTGAAVSGGVVAAYRHVHGRADLRRRPRPGADAEDAGPAEEERVKATFCLVGKQARAPGDRPADRRRRSQTLQPLLGPQPHARQAGPKDIHEDLSKTNEAIRAAAPDAKIPYFRAPGGNFTDALVGRPTKPA